MIDVDKCIKYMKEMHEGQKRKQGTPYYNHPFEVYIMLKDNGFDEEYQVTGLFHDLLEDTSATYEDIVNISNKNVADAVKLLTKEDGYNMNDYINRISNNEIAKVVKICDRIHNITEAVLADEMFRKKYIKETEDWYLDLSKGTPFESKLKEMLNVLKNVSS